MPKSWNIKRFLRIDSKKDRDKNGNDSIETRNQLLFDVKENQQPNRSSKISLKKSDDMAKLNGKTKSETILSSVTQGNPINDSWSSSTDNSPSSRSYTISNTSDSIENNSPLQRGAPVKAFCAIETKMPSSSENLLLNGSNRRATIRETNNVETEKNNAKTSPDSVKEIKDSFNEVTDCANISDYVENALLSPTAGFVSPPIDNSELNSTTLSNVTSLHLNQENTKSNKNESLITGFDLKPDFVSIDFIHSAAVSERQLKSNENDGSCSSSLSSSFLSSIASEDGSIGSDVIENLCSKIAAATAKHKQKTASLAEKDEKQKAKSLTAKSSFSTKLEEGSEDGKPNNPSFKSADGLYSEDHYNCSAEDDTYSHDDAELDYSNCNLKEVPNGIQLFANTLVKLSVESNAIVTLSKELFECRKLEQLILGDNDIALLSPCLAGLTNLTHLDISKNVIEDIPECMPCLKNLIVLDASVNPIEKLSEGFTQLINLQELYMNDCFFDYLPASFGRMSELRVLELRDNQLQILPKSIRRLLNLQRLDLGGNLLQDWPDVISKLSALRELWLDCNELGNVSNEIGQLNQLTYIDLSRNLLQVIPNQIGSLQGLTDLILAENNLAALPDSIGFLHNLVILNIEHNQIEKLPDSIGKLEQLEEFDASHNKLTFLPQSIGKLRKLRMLLLDDNKLSKVPSDLGQCCSLNVLQISRNHIDDLPVSFGQLNCLRVLNICQNRLHHLPITFRNLTRLEALWISPNQSKPTVPVRVEVDPEKGCQVLTNALFPQDENGLSRASRILGLSEDNGDATDEFAIDAADDDDLEAYSRRERGRTQVTFNLSLTTFSDAYDNDRIGDDIFEQNVPCSPKDQLATIDIDRTRTQLNDSLIIANQEEKDHSCFSLNDKKDRDAEQYIIEIPDKHEESDLVVSLDQPDFKLSTVGAFAVKNKAKKEYSTASCVSSPTKLSISSSNEVVLNKKLEMENINKQQHSKKPSSLPNTQSGIHESTEEQSTESGFSVLNNSTKNPTPLNNEISQLKREVNSSTKKKQKPNVPAKPAKLLTKPLHGSTKVELQNLSQNKKEPSRDNYSLDKSLQQKQLQEENVENVKHALKVESTIVGEIFDSSSTKTEFESNLKSEVEISPSYLNHFKDISKNIEFIDEIPSFSVYSENEVNIKNNNLVIDKSLSVVSAESVPATDDSGVGINDADANEGLENTGELLTAACLKEKQAKISMKVDMLTIPENVDRSKSIVNGARSEHYQHIISTKSNVKEINSTGLETSKALQNSTCQLIKPQCSLPPALPIKKSSVANNIKKFEKSFETGIPIAFKVDPGVHTAVSPKLSEQALRSDKSISTTKPMAIATIVSSGKKSSHSNAEIIKTEKPDLNDDNGIVADVLKSFDLYTKGREFQRRKLSSDKVSDVHRAFAEEKLSEMVGNIDSVSSKQQSAHFRKSKFHEALAATKQKHFREKLEKAMQLQKQPSSAGESLRRLSRGSTSSISSIPRITSPIPHQHSSVLVLEQTTSKNKPDHVAALNSTSTRINTDRSSFSNRIPRRGTSICSSTRSTKIQQSTTSEAPKLSLEEQLGQLFLDGSSSSPPQNEKGFVPYLPNDFYQSKNIKSSKEQSSSSFETRSDNIRKPSRPEDWKHQLMDYLERKKIENMNKTHTHSSPSHRKSFFKTSSSTVKIPQYETPNYSSKHHFKNDIKPPSFISNHASASVVDGSHSKHSKPSNSHPKISSRRSSEKYQRTRTPGPEISASEPTIKDLTVRSKSALDRPFHSEVFDSYNSEDIAKKNTPLQEFYKSNLVQSEQPPPIPAPPSYRDHIMRKMNTTSKITDHSNYVNLQDFHNEIRATKRAKASNHQIDSNHVINRSASIQPRDLHSKKHESIQAKHDLSTAHPQNIHSASVHPKTNVPSQDHFPRTPPQQSDYYFLENQSYPTYNNAPVIQQNYYPNPHITRHSGSVYASNQLGDALGYKHLSYEPTGRLIHEHRNRAFEDQHLINPDVKCYQNFHHPSYFPHLNHPYSASVQTSRGYIEKEESSLSAFRPYQHNYSLNHQPKNSLNPSFTTRYQPGHESIYSPYEQQPNLYNCYHPSQQFEMQGQKFIPSYLDERMLKKSDEYYTHHNTNPYPETMTLSPVEDLQHPAQDVMGFGVEVVTVTVRKNPNFGFHIMGGVDAGGNPYRPDDEGVFITYVASGGAADGLVHPGDKILMVNGSDFVGISHKRAVDLLKNAGNSAVLLLERIVGRPV